jgi:hypothetical protein
MRGKVDRQVATQAIATTHSRYFACVLTRIMPRLPLRPRVPRNGGFSTDCPPNCTALLSHSQL